MNVTELPGKILSFKSLQADKELTIHIKGILHNFGGGWFSSWVAEVDTDKGSYVLKKFKVPEDYPTHDPLPAVRAMNNYNLLVDAGLNTWETYLLSEDQEMVLMTNGNTDTVSLISTANDKTTLLSKKLFEHKLKSISNFEHVLDRMITEVKKASENNIYIQTDTYGFILENNSTETQVSSLDFILADLDNVWIDTQDNLLKRNTEQLKFTIRALLELYIIREKALEYTTLLNSRTREFLR